jgi:modification methylase
MLHLIYNTFMKSGQTGRGRRKATRTSSFGAPGHVSHDSTEFYASRLYEGAAAGKKILYVENPVSSRYVNRVFCKSSETMDELPDSSVHLMVTSPPYNVGKQYDADLSLDEYLALLGGVFRETYRVLVPGGRACVNVANLGRKPYLPLHTYVTGIMESTGFLMRGEIIWDKAGSASPSTAWGSYMKAGNPVLRDVHEYILVFCKGAFSRPNPQKRPSTVSRNEFLELTKSVWRFPPERAKAIGHPAPFPVELPYRLIQLYTFEGETVLDPFAGSGSTCVAALTASRRYIGYDTDRGYCRLARQRVKAALEKGMAADTI